MAYRRVEHRYVFLGSKVKNTNQTNIGTPPYINLDISVSSSFVFSVYQHQDFAILKSGLRFLL